MPDNIQLVLVDLTVNGSRYQRHVEPRTLLVEFIREELGLTGTHIGCDTSFCGACTIILNGRLIKSCTALAVQADGGTVETVEGLEQDNALHPLQTAFPGMLMASKQLLAENPSPSRDEIKKGIGGNVCRCTGYQNIYKAVDAAAKQMQES
jgi:aerobic-type carbon monoxide dehydrogenase small subunit (CoxS/CutS family)